MTRAQLQELESFFFTRGADAILEVADVWQLAPWLESQGYELRGSEQVLEAQVNPGNSAPSLDVLDCGEALDDWALAVQLGFGMEPSEDGRRLGQVLASEQALGIRRDGQLAASAAFAVVGDVGYCFADSTLPAFRGRGLQLALIQHRLWLTAQAGAHYSVAETAAGSGSERNYRRAGFAPVFLRQTWVKPRPARP